MEFAPGPSEDEIQRIVALASRTPDHGKLHPWRFVHVPREQRASFAELLHRAYLLENPEPGRLEREASDRFAQQAPELLVALFSPKASAKIPLWEQELSCGAVCMNLLSAASSLGYDAGWVTGWAAYNPEVLAAFGREGERIAGFIFLGTAGAELEERPRPELSDIYSAWSPNG